MKRAFRIAGSVLRWLIIAICVLLCIFIIYSLVQKYAFGNEMPTVFGYAGGSIASGSMDDGSEDAIKQGDFVIVHAEDSYGLEDVVTYRAADGEYVTHRIVQLTPNGYITQGDDKEHSDLDPEITDEDIVGKVVAVISGGGDAIDFMRSAPGLLIILAAGVVIWFAEDIINIIINGRKEKKESAEGVGEGNAESLKEVNNEERE